MKKRGEGRTSLVSCSRENPGLVSLQSAVFPFPSGADHMFRFKELYDKLREMKTEIEHVQHLLQKSKVQIQRDFEEWWKQHSTNRKLSPRAAWHTPPLPLRPGSQSSVGTTRQQEREKSPSGRGLSRHQEARWLTSSVQVVTREAAAAVEGGPHLC